MQELKEFTSHICFCKTNEKYIPQNKQEILWRVKNACWRVMELIQNIKVRKLHLYTKTRNYKSKLVQKSRELCEASLWKDSRFLSKKYEYEMGISSVKKEKKRQLKLRKTQKAIQESFVLEWD